MRKIPDTTPDINVPKAPDDWPTDLREEYEAGGFRNGRVGHRLVSETEKVRVWTLRLKPGERVGLHRHQLDYFWTALKAGRSESNFADGRTVVTDYEEGMTRHFHFEKGECMIHDLCNVGDTEIAFTTVEFLISANPPLPVD